MKVLQAEKMSAALTLDENLMKARRITLSLFSQ